MTNILVTGSRGQIGTELIELLRSIYGREQVFASDITQVSVEERERGPYVYLDVLDSQGFAKTVVDYDIDWIVHNASILSATGERNPELALKVNARGTENAFDVAKRYNLRILSPSSIAAFGPSTPSVDTPDVTIMRPNTMYGVTKVWVELLGEYYHQRFGLDFRSLRYPGIISYKALPGGGTTDYAVEIFYEALKNGKYTSFLRPDSRLPMMYMPDCLKGTVDLLRAEESILEQRVFNLGAFNFTPSELASEIQRHLPDFTIEYQPDYRQDIADGWPNSLDDSQARRQWGWEPSYDLTSMTAEMLEKLAEILNVTYKSAIVV
ncbi:MAG: NAD-dependent epimerase/dehydratase family protein [Candidatus Kariarchaeaceae archaeon]|jgi:threonine 3-dehydrogenase